MILFTVGVHGGGGGTCVLGGMHGGGHVWQGSVHGGGHA